MATNSADGSTSIPAQRERAALCDLFSEVGPDAPTLSGDWTTRDLAAHLIVREGRPDAALGIVLGPLAGYTEKVQAGVADQDWERLVDTVRSGPPVWSPVRLAAIDRVVNTIEFFVHHEDVRRASEPWTVRELDDDERADLRSSLGRVARMLARPSPVGIELSPTDLPADAAGDGSPIVAKKADDSVTVTGGIGELVMFMYGRGDHADVDLEGDAEAVEAVRSAGFGL